METIDTPSVTSIEEVSQFLKVSPQQMIKTLFVRGSDTPMVALALRGDHELNPTKVEKFFEIAKPLTFVEASEIQNKLGCNPGYLGPVGLAKHHIPVIVDPSAAVMTDFICGANVDHKHIKNVNWERDASFTKIKDLRKVVENDVSPDGKGHLKMKRGIEVGHIFQLGNKYSKAMQATVLNEQGEKQFVEMGCYGIGISRIVAAAIEQNHDAQGIIWPQSMSPFDVCLVPINLNKSEKVRAAVEELYQQLQNEGLKVLLDDRNERPGVMFADMDLIGIPHRIVISEQTLADQSIEYKRRTEKDSQRIPLKDFAKLSEMLKC